MPHQVQDSSRPQVSVPVPVCCHLPSEIVPRMKLVQGQFTDRKLSFFSKLYHCDRFLIVSFRHRIDNRCATVPNLRLSDLLWRMEMSKCHIVKYIKYRTVNIIQSTNRYCLRIRPPVHSTICYVLMGDQYIPFPRINLHGCNCLLHGFCIC